MSKLVVFTNVLRPQHQRVGLGAKNNPERRQELIIKLLQTYFEESIIYTSSKPIAYEFLELIHNSDYIDFLTDAFSSWQQSKDPDWAEGDALIPHEFFTKIHPKIPLYKKSGYYGKDTMTPIYEDTTRNALIAAGRAYEAADFWSRNRCDVIYVLACSPGHHAKISHYGGYCFFNNAVIAAVRYQELNKSEKLAILDLDYHAGNGTAEIIASNNQLTKDILAISIHVDPTLDYPSFEGYEDDYPNNKNIINIPLAGGTNKENYLAALSDACDKIKSSGITALIIAFGADTFVGDIDVSTSGAFKIQIEDYSAMGELIRAKLSTIPILVTQEGGYSLEHVPDIVCRFLDSLL